MNVFQNGLKNNNEFKNKSTLTFSTDSFNLNSLQNKKVNNSVQNIKRNNQVNMTICYI